MSSSVTCTGHESCFLCNGNGVMRFSCPSENCRGHRPVSYMLCAEHIQDHNCQVCARPATADDLRTDSDLGSSVRTSSSSIPVPQDAQAGPTEDLEDIRERVTRLEGRTAEHHARLQVLEAAACKKKEDQPLVGSRDGRDGGDEDPGDASGTSGRHPEEGNGKGSTRGNSTGGGNGDGTGNCGASKLDDTLALGRFQRQASQKSAFGHASHKVTQNAISKAMLDLLRRGGKDSKWHCLSLNEVISFISKKSLGGREEVLQALREETHGDERRRPRFRMLKDGNVDCIQATMSSKWGALCHNACCKKLSKRLVRYLRYEAGNARTTQPFEDELRGFHSFEEALQVITTERLVRPKSDALSMVRYVLETETHVDGRARFDFKRCKGAWFLRATESSS